MTVSGLYRGLVTHTRHRPRHHALRKRIFMLLLDLDEAPTLVDRLRWLSYGRFGLMSFDDRDYSPPGAQPLKIRVQEMLAAAGINVDGPVRLLTMPRVLGYGFNPLSIYFCHDADGRLAAILHEVGNTFGERHFYLAAADGLDGVQHHGAEKAFYVSPFMDMRMRYRFAVQPPGDTVAVRIEVEDAEGSRMTASFVARRTPLTDRSLLAAWLAHPLQSLSVIVAIHVQAIRLWRKGIAVRQRLAADAITTTVCKQVSETA